MKITFNFDRDCRAFNMEPEDELEKIVLMSMADATSKGQTLTLSRIDHGTNGSHVDNAEFRVEMRVNGHQAKVQNYLVGPGDSKY
jgi:hypothetical protein